MDYIGNAFSAGSLNLESCCVHFRRVTAGEACEFARKGCVSSVGHADTAALLTEMLGFPVAHNRITLSLLPGDQLLIAQYNGPRLPEGATALPEGARIQWILATVAC